MAVLQLDHVSKFYRTEGQQVSALSNVSFSVERGRFVALVGRSGCGKSTLLNLCGAMDFPSAGTVRVDGQSTSGLPDAQLTALRRHKVGFIFQSYQLLPTLTVLENVELPAMLAGVHHAQASALERLRWVEMEPFAKRQVHQLSGGQMQRVAIARALIHGPSVILADEPTGNLDTATGEIVLQLLARCVREQNCTVVMATHSAESTAYADTVVYLRDGQVERVAAR